MDVHGAQGEVNGGGRFREHTKGYDEMKTMSVSKFKAVCLKEIDLVTKTGEPILITKYGEPVVMLSLPKEEAAPKKHSFGCMKGKMKTLGDIVSPIGEEDWEALK